MTYFPDGTLLRRPSLLEWYKNRCDALGVVSTLSAARRHRSWRTFGWLEPAHEYSIGVCSEELRRLLDDAADHCVDRTRGFQRCLFCPGTTESLVLAPTDYSTADGKLLRLGSASLEVQDATGQVWIAPNLVLHYITDHQYLPPAELADARPAWR